MFNDEYRLSEVQRVYTSEGLITKHILIVKQNKRKRNKRTDITAYQKRNTCIKHNQAENCGFLRSQYTISLWMS